MEDLLRGLSDVLAVPLTPTINVAVALWLLAGLFALRFNLAGWWQRRLILERAAVLDRPQAELELARQRLEAELVALLVQVAFVGIGVLVALEPPPPPRPPSLPPTPWQSLVVAPVLIGVQIGLAFESWRQRRYDRRRAHLRATTDDDHQRMAEGDAHHDASH